MKTYAMVCGDFCKIGRSKNPSRRLNDMKTGNPIPIKLVHTWDGDCESDLHARFSCHRQRGEWFKIEGAVKSMLDELGYNHSGRKTRRKKPEVKFDATMDVYDVYSNAYGEVIDNLLDYCEQGHVADLIGVRALAEHNIKQGWSVDESMELIQEIDSDHISKDNMEYVLDIFTDVVGGMLDDYKIKTICAPPYNKVEKQWGGDVGGCHIFVSHMRSGDLKRTIQNDVYDWWWIFDACFASVLFVSTHAPLVAWEPSPVPWVRNDLIKHNIKQPTPATP